MLEFAFYIHIAATAQIRLNHRIAPRLQRGDAPQLAFTTPATPAVKVSCTQSLLHGSLCHQAWLPLFAIFSGAFPFATDRANGLFRSSCTMDGSRAPVDRSGNVSLVCSQKGRDLDADETSLVLAHALVLSARSALARTLVSATGKAGVRETCGRHPLVPLASRNPYRPQRMVPFANPEWRHPTEPLFGEAVTRPNIFSPSHRFDLTSNQVVVSRSMPRCMLSMHDVGLAMLVGVPRRTQF